MRSIVKAALGGALLVAATTAGAEALPLPPLAPALAPAHGVEAVRWHGGYGWRRPLLGYRVVRPFYGYGYRYGFRRPFYGYGFRRPFPLYGYGYGWHRPFFGARRFL